MSPSASHHPAADRLISVIVVNWNARESLLGCLRALRSVSRELADDGLDLELEVTVVDNASSDGSAAAVSRDFPRFQLVANRRNAGFAAANNQAFRLGRGAWTLLLNPDTVPNAAALVGLVEFLRRSPRTAAAGLRLVDEHGRPQNAFDNFPSVLTELFSKHLLRVLFPGRFPSKRNAPREPFEVDVVIGACLMLRSAVFRELGGFDEDYFLFVEEADLCRRLRDAGHRIYHLPYLQIVHAEHPSKQQAAPLASMENYRSTALYFRKHRGEGLAQLFQVIRGIKLVTISLPLSLIATGCTLGRVPRHVRRLRIRSRLAAWYLLGCPPSWGMRAVSDFAGFTRQKLGGRGERIIARDAGSRLQELLEDPRAYIAARRSTARCVHAGRGRTLHRLSLEESLPPALVPSHTPALPHERGEVLVALYEELEPQAALRRALCTPRGIAEFEWAVERADRGVGDLPVLGACSRGRLSLERDSAVVYAAGEEGEPLSEFLLRPCAAAVESLRRDLSPRAHAGAAGDRAGALRPRAAEPSAETTCR